MLTIFKVWLFYGKEWMAIVSTIFENYYEYLV